MRWRPLVSGLAAGERQRLVVRVYCEWNSVHHVSEVSDAHVDAMEFSIVGTVLVLCLAEMFAEESEGFPLLFSIAQRVAAAQRCSMTRARSSAAAAASASGQNSNTASYYYI